jgi:hypothetical protein
MNPEPRGLRQNKHRKQRHGKQGAHSTHGNTDTHWQLVSTAPISAARWACIDVPSSGVLQKCMYTSCGQCTEAGIQASSMTGSQSPCQVGEGPSRVDSEGCRSLITQCSWHPSSLDRWHGTHNAGRVHDNILEYGAKVNGVPDVGLLCGGEIDALCVAAALDVEDAAVTPAVFIVADERSPRVC